MSDETAVHTRRSRSRHRLVQRGAVIFLAVLAVEVIVVLAIAAWAVTGARNELVAARDHTNDGRAALADLDLETGAASLAAARTRFADGHARLRNPAVGVLRILPVVGANLRTAAALAAGGEAVTGAATDVLQVITDQPGGLHAYLPSDGRFPVERLAKLAAATERAEQRIADAASTVDAAPTSGLVGPVADAREDFADDVDAALEQVRTVARASRAAAALLGAEGPRRYLFGAQNPAELRGTGGYIGAYAEARFDDGSFALTGFTPVQRLTSVPISEVPPPNIDFATRYSRYGGAGFWPAINATPDFPSAAEAMIRLYELTEGVSLDGVIVVDPFALEALLQLVGDVDVPGIGRVGADEAVEVVSNTAYARFNDSAERKAILGTVAGTALQRLLTDDAVVGVDDLVDAVAPIGRERHLMVYSTDPRVQAALVDLEVAGALPGPDDAIAVVVNNAAVNKVDFYIDRSIDYRVRLQPDGSATARLRVVFDNHAPASGPGDHVLGPRRAGFEAGDNLSLVSVFCGRCEPTKGSPALTADGPRAGIALDEELGHTVGTALVRVPRGARRKLSLSWRVPGAWSPDGDGCYTAGFVPQQTIRPTHVRLTVRPPDGFERVGGSEGAVVHDGPVRAPIHEEACYTASGGA